MHGKRKDARTRKSLTALAGMAAKGRAAKTSVPAPHAITPHGAAPVSRPVPAAPAAGPFAAVKPYWGFMVQQQELQHDLSLAWFDCLKQMTSIYRGSRQKGNDAMMIWERCAAPSNLLMGAFASLMDRQSRALGLICMTIAPQARKAELSKETGHNPE